MKVLWITNILFPDICREKKIPAPVMGGWMYSLAKELLKNVDIELAVATLFKGNKLEKHVLNDIVYYLIPSKGDWRFYHKYLESNWLQVEADFSPDVVHLHGTEFPHGLAFLRAVKNCDNVVVSIQGLVSVIARYYLAGMTSREVLGNITFRDIVRKDNLWQAQRSFAQRGKYEREILSRVNHVIGRTSWDQAHTWAVNPNAKYHFCNETLRDEFYKNTWSYEKCEKHSIFLSQAGYPIKGLHQVLKALPFILRNYPDTRVYIAGDNITHKPWYKRSGYSKYIKSLINKYSLQDRIFFLGLLDEQQICEQYLNANVFICPSFIENSPNSLGEAQLLGVPILASYVGGIPEMMKGYQEYMYRFEEVEMLAEKICLLFEAKNMNAQLLQNIAQKRHDRQINVKQLFAIYNSINSKQL